MDTLNQLREENAALQKSLQESLDKNKKLSTEAWQAKSEASLIGANLRGKSEEWELQRNELRGAIDQHEKRANDAENETTDKSWIWGQERSELETHLEQEKGKVDSAKAELDQKAKSWEDDRARLRAALDSANLKTTTAEDSLKEKSAAWNRLEETLRAEVKSASDGSASRAATIATLEKQLREMTIETDALAASGVDAEERLQTSAAKIGFMMTHSRKLKERIAVIEQDRFDLSGIIEAAEMDNMDATWVARDAVNESQLARRQIQMHIIASGAAGAAYNRLKDQLDASRMAQSVRGEFRVHEKRQAHRRFQLHIIAAGAAGVVAARAAQAKLHRQETLMAETQAKLHTMTQERDELTEKLTAASADLGRQRDQASSEYKSLDALHRETLNVAEKTRRALQKEEEKFQALQKEIDQVGHETQTRAQEEQRFHQRQGELTKREEKLRIDTDKFDRYLAAESSRITREIAQINARVKERGEKFEQDEATARGKVQTLYDKVCADEEAVGRAKLELASNVMKDSARLAAIEATNQRQRQVLEDKESELQEAEARILQGKEKLDEAVKAQRRKNESAKVAVEQNEKLVQQAVQRKNEAEAKTRDAFNLLAAAFAEHNSSMTQKDSILSTLQDVNLGLNETNIKLTVAVASLSLENASLLMRPPPPPPPPPPPTPLPCGNPIPSPQSMHSNASSDASTSLAAQDFVFFASGSSKAATTIPDGPAGVIAQVEGMKTKWIRLFGADPNTRLAWEQPGEKASCVNRRARKYSLAVNSGHEGGDDPTSACRKCRLAKIPCIMAWKNSGLLIVLPLPRMFRKGVPPTDKSYWVMD